MDRTYELRAAGVVGTFDGRLPRAFAERSLSEHAAWFGAGRRPLAEFPDKTDVGRIDAPDGPAVAKREAKSTARRLGLRVTRTARAFELGRALADAGGPTVAPLARIVAGDVEVLVTPFVDAPSLHRLLASGEVRASDALVHALADALRSLHGAGFEHRDLKAPNLLVADGPRIVVVDLDGLERAARPRRARDLARLAASLLHTDGGRDAGFDETVWGTLLARYGAPELAGETLRLALAKRERNERVGRPLA